ncbi:MAG: FAD:protein FMN transferase [Rhodobacteraceae bacterium]|nr:FAD:protein FMN transferase [Paracoccaceae bacterium]
MTTLTRRRLLTITACAGLAGSGRIAPPPRLTWRGVAFGADVSITLDGPGHITRPALARARLEIEAYETRFSLFRADSDLIRLNAQGYLPDLDARWHDMLQLSDQLHRATHGLFDPTIQPLWLAHATGGDTDAARAAVGWGRVALPTQTQRGLRLGTGQALSFNGIAQGAATDAVREILRSAGMTRVIIDVGETATIGGRWRVGVSDPKAGHVATVRLDDTALAVSSPAALMLDTETHHILHPHGNMQANWSSVAVVARRAAIADGLSTAGCFMQHAELTCCARKLDSVQQVLVLPTHGADDVISIQV